MQFPSESVVRPSYASDPTPTASGISSPPPAVILGGVRNLDYPSLVAGSGGVMSGVAYPMTAEYDGFAATASAVRTPPSEVAPTSAQGLNEANEGQLELLSAEMNASALYLHDLHQWKKTRQGLQASDDEQARRMWQVSVDSPVSSPSRGSSVRISNVREEVKEADDNAARRSTEKDCQLDSSGNVYT